MKRQSQATRKQDRKDVVEDGKPNLAEEEGEEEEEEEVVVVVVVVAKEHHRLPSPCYNRRM
jgi:hypothetical protein